MYLWLLIIGVFIPQEFASTAIVVTIALQNNYSLWFINLIWVSATAFDIYAGFNLGIVLKERYRDTWIGKKAERWAQALKRLLGKHGEKFSLALLATVNFPFLNALFGAWLDMPFKLIFLLTFIGNFIWYLVLLGTVLGLSSLTSNPDIIFLIIVGIGILSHFLLRHIKMEKK